MTYTLLTLAVTTLVLLFWMYKLTCVCFFRPLSVWKEQKDPAFQLREATILSISTIKKDTYPLLEAEILFENFSGHPIQKKIRFRDGNPSLHRFKKDGKIQISLNPQKKPKNPVSIANRKHQVSIVFMLSCCFLTIAYVAGCYFLMGEAISRVALSPEYYEELFSNSPETSGTFIMAALMLIILFFLFKRLGFWETKEIRSQNWDLMYYGLGTVATVKEYQDTGALINDNPLVRFHYSYLDQKGQIIEGSDQKVIGKLDILGLPDMREVEIMYLPEDSRISRLAENIKSQGISDFIRNAFLFGLFIFSVILVVLFCRDIF
ncbi:MAG: hypothetical protein R2819_05545 [Allomuricauda sp.]